jgi:hypothetical protein
LSLVELPMAQSVALLAATGLAGLALVSLTMTFLI